MISREERTIFFSEMLTSMNVREFTRLFYNLTEKSQYQDVILNFKDTKAVFPSFMAPLCARIHTAKKIKNIDCEIIFPKESSLEKLFYNANWAHYIRPEYYEPSSYEGGDHVPLLKFYNAETQHSAVDRIMNLILKSLKLSNRGQAKALDWSLSEITDNVLNHSETTSGGFVQATTYKEKNRVEFIVADCGIGVPKSLGMEQRQEEALQKAIQEGVTRDKKNNQGNGLFGTYRVAVISEGEFEIISQNAVLISKQGDQLNTKNYKVPVKGTVVRCVVDCSKQDILEKALLFNGQMHDPAFDFIERNFEVNNDSIEYKLRDDRNLLGSRQGGKTIYRKITNLIRTSEPSQKIVIDLDEIYLISSSVADEVFGMIYSELGPLNFMKKIELINLDSTVAKLIDRAIIKRSAQNS